MQNPLGDRFVNLFHRDFEGLLSRFAIGFCDVGPHPLYIGAQRGSNMLISGGPLQGLAGSLFCLHMICQVSDLHQKRTRSRIASGFSCQEKYIDFAHLLIFLIIVTVIRKFQRCRNVTMNWQKSKSGYNGFYMCDSYKTNERYRK